MATEVVLSSTSALTGDVEGSDSGAAAVYPPVNKFASIEDVAPLAGSARRKEQCSDRRLLQGVRRASPEAAEALIERHWDRAHRIAYGILGDAHAAEDVTQEAMLSVIANIGRFDPYRPFAPWLHAVVSNRALDWTRAHARRAELPVNPSMIDGRIDGLTDLDAGSEDRLNDGENSRAPGPDPALEAALASLSPEHRAVIVLRFVTGYGPKQIGQALGIPTGTVGSRLRRALDQLRTELEVADG